MQIPLVGQHLTVIPADYSLILRSGNGFEIQVQGQADLEAREGDRRTVRFCEGVEVDLDVNEFFSGTVGAASTGAGGELFLEMASGNRVTVAADTDVESWTIVGPEGYRIVCMPGGELATWTAAHSPQPGSVQPGRTGNPAASISRLIVERVDTLGSRPDRIFVTGTLSGAPIGIGDTLWVRHPEGPIPATVRGIELHTLPGKTTIALDAELSPNVAADTTIERQPHGES